MMMKRIILGLVLALLFAAAAEAQTIITLGCAVSSGTTCTTPSGRNYSSWGALTTALNGTALSAPTQIQVYNDGAAVPSDGSVLTITTSATYSLTLMPAAGQGFADSGTPASKPLRYDSHQGAAIEGAISGGSVIQINSDFVTVRGLQIRNSANGLTLYVNASSGSFGTPNIYIDRNIISAANVYYSIAANNGWTSFTNNVCIYEGGGVSNSYFVQLNPSYPNATTGALPTIQDNIFAAPAGTNAWGLVLGVAGGANVQNNIFTGFATPISAPTGTPSGGNNAMDISSASFSFPTTITGNVYNLALTTANFTAYNFATAYGSSGTLDLRPVAGAAYVGQGVASSNPTTDILGRARGTPYDIGPWAINTSSGPTYDATKMFLSF